MTARIERVDGAPALGPLYLRAALGALPVPGPLRAAARHLPALPWSRRPAPAAPADAAPADAAECLHGGHADIQCPYGHHADVGVGGAAGRHDGLPDRVLVRDGVVADPAGVARYARLCGFGLGDALPPTYPHLLAFGLQVSLMARREFPLPLPGLVHLRNTITVRRAIGAAEPMQVRVHAGRLAAHPKGATVDLVTEVHARGEPVWSGVSTYLARGASGPGADAPAPEPAGVDGGPPAAVWRVPAGTGRRYAAVSGDVNPIHLHAVTARAFGFPRAIAHGMWTAARALAGLQGRLPDALRYDVAFARPLLLPSTVEMRTRSVDAGWDLDVRATRTGKVHLTGAVRPA